MRGRIGRSGRSSEEHPTRLRPCRRGLSCGESGAGGGVHPVTGAATGGREDGKGGSGAGRGLLCGAVGREGSSAVARADGVLDSATAESARSPAFGPTDSRSPYRHAAASSLFTLTPTLSLQGRGNTEERPLHFKGEGTPRRDHSTSREREHRGETTSLRGEGNRSTTRADVLTGRLTRVPRGRPRKRRSGNGQSDANE